MRFSMLLGILCLVAGCDTTEEPQTPPMEGPLAELSHAMAQVQSDYLEANRPLLQGLAALLPYMEAVLRANPASSPNCLSPVLAGRTFAFDGAVYESDEAPGAPGTSVRFLLYNVNAAGTPLLTRARGYVEIGCAAPTAPISVSVQVVSETRRVMQLDVTGEAPTQLTWTGMLGTPDGTSTVPWGGDILGDQNTFHAQLSGGVRVLYSVLGEGVGTPENVLVQALRGVAPPDWELFGDILVEPTGEIMEGPVRLATIGGSHLAACMSGTLEMPTFQSASTGGCVYFGLTALDLSGSDLNTLQGSYLVLRDLYLVSRSVLESGLASLSPISGVEKE